MYDDPSLKPSLVLPDPRQPIRRQEYDQTNLLIYQRMVELEEEIRSLRKIVEEMK